MGEETREQNQHRRPSEAKLVASIFEHSQGDPRTESLLIMAACLYDPSWKIERKGFVRRHLCAMAALTGRRERHPSTGSGKIKQSLERFRDTHRDVKEFLAQRNRYGNVVTLDDISTELAREIICRDWLYLVHDGGRPKIGLTPQDNYDPNLDRYFSYTAHYALWKNNLGERRKTGTPFLDVIYQKIGRMLENNQVDTLGIETKYDEGHGMPIVDKLHQALVVYNISQQALGAPERCVPETFGEQLIASSVLPNTVRRNILQ